MKRISAIPLIIVILLIIFFSCNKSELEYSCDPTINMFVKENLDELSLLTTNELTLYNLKLQRAIFNSWDLKKKSEIWIDKLQQVQINVTFSAAETSHIQSLIDHINEDYFSVETLKINLRYFPDILKNGLTMLPKNFVGQNNLSHLWYTDFIPFHQSLKPNYPG